MEDDIRETSVTKNGSTAKSLPKTGSNSVAIHLPQNGELRDRVVAILDQARSNVVRVINSNMVIA